MSAYREGTCDAHPIADEVRQYDRYVREIGAKLVHEDGCGRLWNAPVPGDETLAMVEVLNPTQEPDGTTKTYWLRVPPTMRRAKEAVAWTFSLPEDAYSVLVET